MREGKRIQRERGIKYLHYTETGKVMTQVECHKLCVHNVIFREINKKTTQGDTLKNTTDKSKWGLPWWLSGKESVCQCRRCGFDPWVGKMHGRRDRLPTPEILIPACASSIWAFHVMYSAYKLNKQGDNI